MLKQKLLVIGLMAALSTTAMGFSLDSVVKGAAVASEVCKFAGKAIDEKGLGPIQQGLVKSAKQVSQDYLGAQSKLASALNMKEAVAQLKAQADVLKKGNINSDKLEKVTTVGAAAGEAIEKQLKEAEKLTDKQKEEVKKSLSKYGDAALGTAGLAGKTLLASGAVLCVASNNPLNAMKIKDKFSFVGDAASTLPGFAGDLITTGFSYVKLLKRFDIDTSAFEKQLKNAQSELSKAEK